MTVKPIEAAVLIILAMMSLAISAHAGELRDFRPDWCSPNRFRQSSDVDQICYGEATFLDDTTVRAIGFRVIDGPNEIYVENDYTSVDMMNLAFDVVGPVQNSFSTEIGHVRLSVDDDGEVNAVQGQSARHGRFGAFRDSRNEMP